MSNISIINGPTRRRVRVLDGPLRGATHVLGDHCIVGRSGTSDLQLLDDGVSREHAQIISRPGGIHILVDLRTTNGTFIGDRRVEREILERGTIFSIVGTRFIYEDVEPVRTDCEDSGVYAVEYHGAPSRRGTMEYVVASIPGLADQEQPERQLGQGGWRRPESSVTAECTGGEQLHRVQAKNDDGTPYEGNLIEDVLDYRRTGLRLSRGEVHDESLLEQVEQLEGRLCLPVPRRDGAPAIRRTFKRFSCYFPAGLRQARGANLNGVVLDFGVDGAQLLAYRHGIAEDTIVWLAIDVVTKTQTQTVVFPSRVAWTSRNHLGLSFSSQPGWRPARGVDPRAPTRLDLDSSRRTIVPHLAVVAAQVRSIDE
ncbi:MAG: FHA domain-containing protein [Deltaproteobacteria bacterium]|nr:FHA domain-containing protein [Deltaproteobacteria bacterium]